MVCAPPTPAQGTPIRPSTLLVSDVTKSDGTPEADQAVVRAGRWSKRRHERLTAYAAPFAEPSLVARLMAGAVGTGTIDAAVADGLWHPTLDSLGDSIAIVDDRGAIVAVNRAWTTFAQANGGVDVGVASNYLSVCERAASGDPLAADVADALHDFFAGARTEYMCAYPCHAPGQERWFSLRIARLQGIPTLHLIVSHHDITVEHEAEQRGEDQAELLNAVGAAITVTDLDGIVRHWSDGAQSMYGWSAAEVVGRPLTMVTVVPEHRGAADRLLRSIVGEGQWEGQLEVCHRDGRRFPVDVRNRLLRDAEGRPTGVIGISVDVTDRVAMERQLRGARDFRDVVLQTVPNGLYVLDTAGRVTFVNEAAENLLGWRGSDLLGACMHERIHALTVDGAPRPAEQSVTFEALRASTPLRVDDDVFQRQDGTLMPVAYSAAPFTSEAGAQGTVVVFNDITERKARELSLRRELDALTWVGRIREALKHDRFVLYAQPIVDIASGRTVQHELLLRMIGPDGETIAPDEFLPAAEEHGLIREIDRRVFEKALAYAMAGHAIEVNLSADSVGDPTLFRFVEELLGARGVDPRLVVFEITETALIGNEGAAQAFTKDVVALGSAVALDDFGTGFGSFRYLKHLPVGLLKIDREFVGDCDGPDGAASRHVITAIVSLARGMGKRTIAEGVETEAALAVVRELGVDSAQGYLFARPLPADEVFRAIDRTRVPQLIDSGRRG